MNRLFILTVCLGAVLPAHHLLAGDELPLHRQIDEQVTAALPKWKLSQVSGPAGDEEFLRRISLDLTGIIPEAAAVRAFAADSDRGKRAKLVDKLLASDAYGRHMAVVFDVMLMERRADKYVPTPQWRAYLAESFQRNKPLDVLVREILGSDGVDPQLRAAAKFVLDREVSADVLVRDIGRLFLGVDLQCAQCHDHPSVTDYRHEHYYGLQAFIAGAKLFKQPDGAMVLQENPVREVSFASVFDPSKSKKTGPRLLDGPALEMPSLKEGEEYVEKPSSKVRAVPKFSLRQQLAETLPRAETPAFARNLANRLWALMLGRGLVNPLDMHHGANLPSHPELLTLLAEQLAAMKFDARAFLREIALSETYQRSSLAPEGVAADEAPIESLAVGNLKGLSAEQLFASLVRATGNEKSFESEIDELIQLKPEEERTKLAADATLRQKFHDEELAKRVAEFAALFGSPAGTPETEFQASLPQALFLANGPPVVGGLTPRDDNLTARLLAIADAERVAEEAYLSVLSRFPSDEEKAIVRKHLSEPDERPVAIQQLVWSLLASAEFRINH